MSKNTPLSDRPTRFSPDDPGGPGTPIQGPPLLLDGVAIWERYKWPLVGAVLLLILALLGSELYRSSQRKRNEAANTALNNSRTITEYQAVTEQYPGTLAAANAYLLLAHEQVDAKDFAGAAATWQLFTEKYPKHPQVAAALLARGNALEAQGKSDEARTIYEQVASAYANDYVAPAALVAEALLFKSQRKLDDARRVFENVAASYPNSGEANQAKLELRYLNSVPPLNAPAPTPTPAPSVAPAASTTPAPSTPPAAPVVVPAAPEPASATPAASPDASPIPVASPESSPAAN